MIKKQIQRVSTTLKVPQTWIEIPKVQTQKQGPFLGWTKEPKIWLLFNHLGHMSDMGTGKFHG